jgi:carbamoyl-phosphate synthase large subunit
VRDSDKPALEPVARGLAEMGFGLVATGGTARDIQLFGIECTAVNKVTDGSPHVLDLMREGHIAAVINTPDEKGTADSFLIRRTALELRVPFFTTIAGAQAAIEAIAALKVNPLGARALQDYHSG